MDDASCMNTGQTSVAAPGFARHLRGFGEEQLERHEGPVFGLTGDLELAYLNPAWFRFARDNQGDPSPCSAGTRARRACAPAR